MRSVDNERGAVLVFITLMIVLLMVMVGMGLDTGQLTYTRSQGQAAVDAAALSAVSGLPMGATAAAQVTARVAAFNSNNDYLSSPTNPISAANITYIQYNSSTGALTDLPSIANANGVRVALEKTNPYTSVAAGTAMQSPVFLTPLMNLFGQAAPAKVDVSVSAVAALRAIPGIPIAVMQNTCGSNSIWLRQSNANVDNSCWTTYTQNPPSASAVKALFESSGTCSSLPASTGLITIGTEIELNNGQQASTYDAAGQLFITDYPGNCWMVPVVPNATKCNQQDPIIDWAEICPTNVVKQGSPKYIEAKVTCGQDLYRIKSNLCFSSRLLRDTKSGM